MQVSNQKSLTMPVHHGTTEFLKEVGSWSKQELAVRRWIIHSLNVYPVLSRSLLGLTVQACRQARLPGSRWQDILMKLVNEGVVHKYTRMIETPMGRIQDIEFYSLNSAKAEIYVATLLPNTIMEAANAEEQ